MNQVCTFASVKVSAWHDQAEIERIFSLFPKFRFFMKPCSFFLGREISSGRRKNNHPLLYRMCDIQNILTFWHSKYFDIFLPSPTSGYGVTEIFNLKFRNLGKTLLKQDNYWNTVTNTWKSNKPASAEAPTYKHKFYHFKPQIKKHSTALRNKHFASKNTTPH